MSAVSVLEGAGSIHRTRMKRANQITRAKTLRLEGVATNADVDTPVEIIIRDRG